MKRILGASCAVLVLVTLAPAQAWANPQHERMKRCNAEAREQALKGEERKAFMSDCLKNGAAKPGEKSLTPQQQKMRECNAKATEQSLKGDDRSKFMSACLKKKV